jgi:hypothetical protein
MSRSEVIICDPHGLWTAALARRLDAEFRLRQLVSLRECSAQLAIAPSSLMAIHVTPKNLVAVLDWMLSMSESYPLARAIALVDRRLAQDEWLLREAGAVVVVTSQRDLAGIEQVVRQHLARSPRSPVTRSEQIWQSLPWSDVATN